MAYESGSSDLSCQIRRAGAFFFLAAIRRWQAELQAKLMEACISLNKVSTGSLELGPSGQPWTPTVLRLLAATLQRLELMRRTRSGGFHKAEPLDLCCFFFDSPPLLDGKIAEFDGDSVRSDWKRGARFGGALDLGVSFLLCRKGSGKGSGWIRSVAPPGDLLAANHGVPQRRRFSAAVISGQGGCSVPWCFLLHGVFNLQAGVPQRRPFISSAVALNVPPSPSGVVPGDGADGYCVELLFFLGGEGPNCVPKSLFEVLFVKSKDLAIIFFYFVVLDVICNPTD